MDKEIASPEDGQGLPGYNAGTLTTELVVHQDVLEDSKGSACLWLNVKSRAKDPKHVPSFVGTDTITGTVEVDFDKMSSVKSVSVALMAGITAVGQEETSFLHIPQTLWDGKISSSAKLSGKQSWPFSISIPAEASMVGKDKRAYPLPPSFSERASPVYIEYKLVLTLRRGVLRADRTLATSILYLPLWRADPHSQMRQPTYSELASLPGPDDDLEGWKVLNTVLLTGTLFDTRQVELQCTLAIARPVCYARGSPIPLFLTITSDDDHATDLLATPAAVKLRLICTRVLGPYATEENSTPPSDRVFQETVGTAFFWPAPDGVSGTGKRTLHGELSVKMSLKPSSVFPGFALRYHLVLLPLQAAGFVSKTPTGERLLTEEVKIAPFNAVGVVPRSFAPPGYVHVEEGDYNNSVGYLENGNQR
ncbi:uncharacterized protein LAESUDRAFT_731262 [Laetiporus sulphureus 93-53]|uniref:Arrestin-like N-terminal domain-containing protein n=1 Tax=Laetiporus sulphureus 93-53 TaxID=1314785 RepID=A0A165BP62_9APHY|nr:uncharacterized protein LAESUDRAFT_731262 [Laetiporus sulphureus 93-53]KZT01403.1 hypothetical protein LAESUDRAFT_731262 [Laetiporus sulphureus 93-53]